jgi:hypothetical protein
MSKVMKVEEEINKYFNDKKELEEVNKPCWVFITFENEEGKERAMAYF